MTKKEFLELKNKHSYENQYKVKNKKELEELVKLAESIDVHMDLNWLDVSNITNMCCLFKGSKFNGNISKWDVSNVTNMNYMFGNSKFNGYLGGWDVSKVTNMTWMFINSKFKGYLGGWDVSNVEYAGNFNSYLNIDGKEDLKNYISFLKAIHEDKPLNMPIKKEWWKTKDLPLYIANRMNRDKEFTENIKRALCSGEH